MYWLSVTDFFCETLLYESNKYEWKKSLPLIYKMSIQCNLLNEFHKPLNLHYLAHYFYSILILDFVHSELLYTIFIIPTLTFNKIHDLLLEFDDDAANIAVESPIGVTDYDTNCESDKSDDESECNQTISLNEI